MARAKRTSARAEARRRYRATLTESEDGELLPEGEAPEPAPRQPARATPAPASTAPQRPSLKRAFRDAFRPFDLRGDLASIPALVRHRSFLLPTILSGLTVAIIPFTPATLLPLAFTLYQYFAFTTPMGAAFFAGFLAPRASWVVGGMVGLLSVGFQALAFNGPYLGLFNAEEQSRVLSEGLVVGVPSAAMFAAAAAWYKRFLALANPNRAARRQQAARRSSGRQPRRDDGRRPMLARRR